MRLVLGACSLLHLSRQGLYCSICDLKTKIIYIYVQLKWWLKSIAKTQLLFLIMISITIQKVLCSTLTQRFNGNNMIKKAKTLLSFPPPTRRPHWPSPSIPAGKNPLRDPWHHGERVSLELMIGPRGLLRSARRRLLALFSGAQRVGVRLSQTTGTFKKTKENHPLTPKCCGGSRVFFFHISERLAGMSGELQPSARLTAAARRFFSFCTPGGSNPINASTMAAL